MILYLLKSALCLILLIMVYRLLLVRTGTFLFNRFFLLFAICFSLTIPLVEISEWKKMISGETPVISAIAEVEHQIVAFEEYEINAPASKDTVNESDGVMSTALLSIYVLVLLILVQQYILNIRKLLIRGRESHVIYHQGIKLHLLNENIAPHSFLNRIFIGKEDYKKGVSIELLTHELAHVQQKHTYDILFVELVKIIFWFNPILCLYAKAIRVNHEYLADRSVIESHENVKDYQLQLLQYMSRFKTPALVSQLNYSFTKNRFKMMKKKISKTAMVISITALIPALFLALMAFSPTIEKIEKSVETGVRNMEALIEPEVHEEENTLPSILPINEPDIHRVSSGFGQRRNPLTKKEQWHLGMDFTADTGVEVLATADGKVTVAIYKIGYGNHIKIDHGNGYETFYAHMHELKVSEGQNLKMGDIIGTVGSTGKSLGPHLHYEVIKDSNMWTPKILFLASQK